MAQAKVYSFLDDFVFKAVFGHEGNQRLLVNLLNALLHRRAGERITSLDLLNPFNLKETEEAKLTIVDVKARDELGHRYLIEVQVRSQPTFAARSIYYLCRLFGEQMQEGEPFGALCLATGISLMGFRHFPEHDRVQSIFRFKETAHGNELTDLLELHFIELPKVGKKPVGRLHTTLEKWLNVLIYGARYGGEAPLPPPLASEEEIAMAVRELKRINADQEMRQLLELREKNQHDAATLLDNARRDGEAKGRAKGRAELVQRMAARGMKVAEIAQVTGLDPATVEMALRQPTPEP